MPNPYLFDGPAMLSFSGGKTSGYMLRKILDTYDGTLPATMPVLFANTGKEKPETLDFVREIETRWNVPIVWLEYRGMADSKTARYAVVDYATASRDGEPFEQLIRDKKYLPNTVTRFCTDWLKLKCFIAFMKDAGFGDFGDWANIVGIRADEPLRIAKMHERNSELDEDNRLPLVTDGVTETDVLRFWGNQPFNLALEAWEGNCDLCFLKGQRIRTRILADLPQIGNWWQEMEVSRGATFDKKLSIAGLRELADRPMLPGLFSNPKMEFTGEGGISCLCHD